jgi:drug/metabolite transporter (DMT)-like permease
LTGALQQFAAGAVYFLVSLLTPSPPVHWTPAGIAGLVWLVTFGSIVGYSAYIYSLATLPVSLVSIYTYINPVVAVLLGKMIYDEPFGRKEVVAMIVIFLGVVIVKMRPGSVRASSLPEPRRQSSEA